MASTFTKTSGYSTSSHYLDITTSTFYIRRNSDNVAVLSQDLTKVFAFRVASGEYQVGTVGYNPIGSYFTRTVDLTPTNAGITFNPSTTKILGTTDTTDNGATKQTYLTNTYPLKMVKSALGILTFTYECSPSNCTSLNPDYVQVN